MPKGKTVPPGQQATQMNPTPITVGTSSVERRPVPTKRRATKRTRRKESKQGMMGQWLSRLASAGKVGLGAVAGGTGAYMLYKNAEKIKSKIPAPMLNAISSRGSGA